MIEISAIKMHAMCVCVCVICNFRDRLKIFFRSCKNNYMLYYNIMLYFVCFVYIV